MEFFVGSSWRGLYLGTTILGLVFGSRWLLCRISALSKSLASVTRDWGRFFDNRAGGGVGALGGHASQTVVSQIHLADDLPRHGADWNCVCVVLGMGEINCYVGGNFHFNHSHSFRTLVVASGVRPH
jgi:hypothetical protein